MNLRKIRQASFASIREVEGACFLGRCGKTCLVKKPPLCLIGLTSRATWATRSIPASTHVAATLGDKFSIIVGRRKWIPEMMENVVRYGMKERLASFKSVDLGVLEFHQDEQETARRFRQVGREAVERDGAEVIILGCTATYGFYRELQQELGVPVIDSMIAAFKTAEFTAELRNRFGWSHSKIGGYESPPPEEFTPWRLEEQYDFGDMRTWLLP